MTEEISRLHDVDSDMIIHNITQVYYEPCEPFGGNKIALESLILQLRHLVERDYYNKGNWCYSGET